MDAKVVLALLVLSHTVADFIWQDNNTAREKKTCFGAMLRHIRHYLWANILLLSPYIDINNNLWWIIIVLALAHWAIDKWKVNYDKVQDKGLESFIYDQTAHFVLIGACYPLIKDIHINQLAHTVSSVVVDNYPIFMNLTKQNAFIGIVILAGYIFNFKGATIITKKVLDKYLHLKESDVSKNSRKEFVKQAIAKHEYQKHNKAVEDVRDSRDIEETTDGDEPKNAGEAIGNLERILILTLVLQKNYTAIGLVIAGKALARYKRLEEKNFAEYFLIGTFTSIMIAYIIGILIEAIVNV